MPELTKDNRQKGLNVLSAWTMLEILSPTPFQEEESEQSNSNTDKAHFNGKEEVWNDSNNNKAPWEEKAVKRWEASKNRYFYQIVMGRILLRESMDALIKVYGTEEGEEYKHSDIKKEALVAVITVDENGFLIEKNRAINISSFAWALPKALKRNLKELNEWTQAEKEIEDRLWQNLQSKDPSGKNLPLSFSLLDKAYADFIQFLGIEAQLINPKKIAIKRPVSEEEDYPSPLNVNSFYLDDLSKASALIKLDQAPELLLKYLGTIQPIKKINVQGPHKEVIIEEAVAPLNTPQAKWPGNRENSLVLLQQVAVNLAAKKLSENDILGINGPPGTGKTTLLRDIIASIIYDRAEKMASFKDVKEAFPTAEEITLPDNKTLTLYNVDERLQGFEIVIASSNNKAAENISTELPKIEAIDKDINLRYFHTISDALLRKKGSTWGLMSAVLGKNENIAAFIDKFWNDKDRSLATYLLEIRGQSRKITPINSINNKTAGLSRPPLIVSENKKHMPVGYKEALEKWEEARKSFLRIKQETKERFDYLEEIRTYIKELDTLGNGSENLEELIRKLEGLIDKNKKLKPSFFFRLLNTRLARSWKKEYKWLSRLQNLSGKIKEDDLMKLAKTLINKKFFRKSDEEIQQTSPWYEPSTQLLREKLFIAAIELHKAFINVAAEQIYENLSAFSLIVENKGHAISFEKRQRFIKDLWATFFLVVPSVSTTFASVGRMLKDIHPNTWGWLLIDEGGQALPQAAVGAIMRSKRVIVTGDPLQIKPFLNLPNNVTKAVCREFDVDANRFNVPEASVQTLGDEASSYFAEFIDGNGIGTRKVGVPLLVHRRCSEPMFRIANEIAYDGKMVYGKKEKESPIKGVLGRSRWFHVEAREGSGSKIWCPEEDKQVTQLLLELQREVNNPDLYIITPFKKVAENLRKTIQNDTAISKRWLTGLGGDDEQRLSKDDWKHINSWVHNRIATIHTMQGREAEAIILVLGAQGSVKAREWASKEPNLLNVAVTRAKEAIYVIGNKELWKKAGEKEKLFEKLYDIMEGGKPYN